MDKVGFERNKKIFDLHHTYFSLHWHRNWGYQCALVYTSKLSTRTGAPNAQAPRGVCTGDSNAKAWLSKTGNSSWQNLQTSQKAIFPQKHVSCILRKVYLGFALRGYPRPPAKANVPGACLLNASPNLQSSRTPKPPPLFSKGSLGGSTSPTENHSSKPRPKYYADKSAWNLHPYLPLTRCQDPQGRKSCGAF